VKQHQPEKNWQPCACGKRGWVSRKAARAVRRKADHAELMSTYACPVSGLFHIGHLPPQVADGRLSRADLGASAPRRGRGAA